MNQEVLNRLLHHLQNSFLPLQPSFMQHTQVWSQESYSYQQATAAVNIGSHAVGLAGYGMYWVIFLLLIVATFFPKQPVHCFVTVLSTSCYVVLGEIMKH
jgi:hypothetical protein